MKVNVPEGKQGDWKVAKFTVDILDVVSLALGRGVPMGQTYTRLTYKDEVVMSDTPAEQKDHLAFITQAQGNVLIAGLGLGMVLCEVAKKESVSHVTVIEKSKEVIKLVAPTYKAMFKDKITIINDDIFKWEPDQNAFYDYAWYDIWNDICSENIKEMNQLHRKFAKCTEFQDSWSKYIFR